MNRSESFDSGQHSYPLGGEISFEEQTLKPGQTIHTPNKHVPPDKPLPPVPSQTQTSSQVATGALGGTETPSTPQGNVGSEHLGANNFTRFLPSREFISNMIHSAWEAVSNKASSVKQSVTKENIQKAGVIVWNVIKRAPSEIATASVKQGREMKEELQENLKDMKDLGVKGYNESVEKTKAGYASVVKVIGRAKTAASEAFKKLRDAINDYKAKRQERRSLIAKGSTELARQPAPQKTVTFGPTTTYDSEKNENSGFEHGITEEEAEAILGRPINQNTPEVKSSPPSNLEAWRGVDAEPNDPFPSNPYPPVQREPKGKEKDTDFEKRGFKKSDVPEEAFDLPAPPNMPLPPLPNVGSAKVSENETKTKWNRGLLNGVAAAIFRHPVQSIVKPLANRVKSNPEKAMGGLPTQEEREEVKREIFNANLDRLSAYAKKAGKIKEAMKKNPSYADTHFISTNSKGKIKIVKHDPAEPISEGILKANEELANLILSTASLGAELEEMATKIYIPGTEREKNNPETRLNLAGLVTRFESINQILEGTKLDKEFVNLQQNSSPALAGIMSTQRAITILDNPGTKQTLLDLHQQVHGESEVFLEIREGKTGAYSFNDLIGDPQKVQSGVIVAEAIKIQKRNQAFLVNPKASIIDYLKEKLPQIKEELSRKEALILNGEETSEDQGYESLEEARNALVSLEKEEDHQNAKLELGELESKEAEYENQLKNFKGSPEELEKLKEKSLKTKSEATVVRAKLGDSRYNKLSFALNYIDSQRKFVAKYEKWVNDEEEVQLNDPILEQMMRDATNYNDALSSFITNGLIKDFKDYCDTFYREFPTHHYYAGQSNISKEEKVQNEKAIADRGQEFYDLKQGILESLHLSRLQEGEAEGKGGIKNLYKVPGLIREFITRYPPTEAGYINQVQDKLKKLNDLPRDSQEDLSLVRERFEELEKLGNSLASKIKDRSKVDEVKEEIQAKRGEICSEFQDYFRDRTLKLLNRIQAVGQDLSLDPPLLEDIQDFVKFAREASSSRYLSEELLEAGKWLNLVSYIPKPQGS